MPADRKSNRKPRRRPDLKVAPRRTIPRMMGASEAAACLGINQTNLRTVSGLPQPVQHLGRGYLWLAEEIEQFKITRDLMRAEQERETNAPTEPKEADNAAA